MCTVSFFRISQDEYMLTSNRDEKIIRPTKMPEEIIRDGKKLLFPMDEEKGGSWIAAGENGRIACLLNGAFEPHVRNPPYSKSRGIVLLDSLNFSTMDGFTQTYSLNNVEPFTLISTFRKDKHLELFELRWDGNISHVKKLNPEIPHLWNSATLYTKYMQNERLEYFNRWIKKYVPEVQSIKKFHFSSTADDPNGYDILMKGKYGLRTVSFTQVKITPHKIFMHYMDLIHQKESINELKILQ